MAYHEDSSASGQDEPWIQWFCNLKGHEMFCKVERSYIEDGFNLYGLRQYVANFSDCLDLILDRIGPEDSDDSHLTQSACTLYGLIHARYIITAHGLDAMYNKVSWSQMRVRIRRTLDVDLMIVWNAWNFSAIAISKYPSFLLYSCQNTVLYCIRPFCRWIYLYPPTHWFHPSWSRKHSHHAMLLIWISLIHFYFTWQYANKDFGHCPSIQCYGQPVLPIGLHDECGMDHFKIYCPKCQNVYHPPPYMRIKNGESRLGREHQADGAAFGTTFAHLFLMTFNNLVPDRPSKESAYVPRVFGFRVHSSARQRIIANNSNSNTSNNSTNNNSNSNNSANAINANTKAITNGNSPGAAASSNANTSTNSKKSSSITDAKPAASTTATATEAATATAGTTSNNVGDATKEAKDNSSVSQSKGKKGKVRKSKSDDASANAKRRPGKSWNGGDDSKKRPKRP